MLIFGIPCSVVGPELRGRWERSMKKFFCAVVVFTLMLSLTAFASEGKGKVKFSDSVQVAGKQLDRGDYKLVWSGNGSEAQVTFTSSDKKSTFTTVAKIVAGAKADSDSLVVTTERVLK